MGQITPGQTCSYTQLNMGHIQHAAAAGSYVGRDLPFVLCTQAAESQLEFSWNTYLILTLGETMLKKENFKQQEQVSFLRIIRKDYDYCTYFQSSA